MRLDCLLILCLCAGVAFWAVGVVCACRDRGLVPRATLAVLGAKAALAVVKQFRQLGRGPLC